VTTQIAEYSETEAGLADLRQKFKGVVFDVATRTGMVDAIKARAELRTTRVALEKKRVELKAPALERSRLIDAEAKRITAEILALEDPIDAAIKAEEGRKERERQEREAAEAARKQAIQQRIEAISNTPGGYVGKESGAVAAALADMRSLVIDEATYAEFAVSAGEAKGRAIAALEQLYAGAVALEQQRAEIAREQAAARDRAQREQQEREARERQEAAEKAERDAAEKARRDALEAEEKAAKERIAAAELAAAQRREAEEREAAVAREAHAAEAKRQREAQEKLDADRREVERAQAELVDAGRMLDIFVERYGKRAEFSGIVKAIRAYQAKAAEAEAAKGQ
jgi:colicin import membrane protein